MDNFGGWDSGSESDEAFLAATEAASNRKASNLKGKTVKKGGGFQAMGLNPVTLKAIAYKGYSVPTPIQRKTIPLILNRQDVVGMARTGSGKTAAFVIPMLERLKSHSTTVGSRAIILSPSRELAIQTHIVVKELGRGTDLRAVLLVGGESLEDQFQAMTTNPDIIIATTGRFHHLKVEMNLDLSSVQYIVCDEADRLFELGFAVQLTELLHALPPTRQTLLFSATLPKSLVEFARAGLQEPTLVRLDADSKISPDLKSAFFTVRSSDKEAALLHIIQDIIQIPITTEKSQKGPEKNTLNKSVKRKRQSLNSGNKESPTLYSTIVFTATKHHVEYIKDLLRIVGYQVSYVYGALDQTARKLQADAFRAGDSNILVVTDVAARGIDIPILANVINYDFPSQPKAFVHRVGRTARAGRHGWSYSLVGDTDLPYLIDLQLFLSRPLVLGVRPGQEANFAQDIVTGALPRDKLGESCEWITKLLAENYDLSVLHSVASNAETKYIKSRNRASIESFKRAKELFDKGTTLGLNALFSGEADQEMSSGLEDMLTRIRNYRPRETIFEIGKRNVAADETVEAIRRLRRRLDAKRSSIRAPVERSISLLGRSRPVSSRDQEETDIGMKEASDNEIKVVFPQKSQVKSFKGASPWVDAENFLSYTPRVSNADEEKAYGVHSGSSNNSKRGLDFLTQAQSVTMDLVDDEFKGFGTSNQHSKVRWDKKGKKYVNSVNDEDGSRGVKKIVGESGLKIPASLRSGRFDRWKRDKRIERIPRVGEAEPRGLLGKQHTGRRFKQHAERFPKQPDKYRDNYHKQKKKWSAAKERLAGQSGQAGQTGKKELRSVDDAHKQRKLKDRRRERNGRPSKKRA